MMSSFLAITTNLSTDAIVKRLSVKRCKKSSINSAAFFGIDFDHQITKSFVELLRSGVVRQWHEICFYGCYNIDPILAVIASFNVTKRLVIRGKKKNDQTNITSDSSNNTNNINEEGEEEEEEANYLGYFGCNSIGFGLSIRSILMSLRISDLKLDANQCQMIANGFEKTKCLTHLTLNEIKFQNNTINAITCISQGLKGNKSLKDLTVFRCNLEDGPIEILVQNLMNHPGLSNINLGGNFCRANGLSAIGDMIHRNKVLKSISLRDQNANELNGFGTFDVSILVDKAFKGGNHSLQILDLSSNMLNDNDFACIAQHLWSCTQLQELNVMSNNLTLDALRILASEKPSRLQTLYMARNPGMINEHYSNRNNQDFVAQPLLDVLRVHCLLRVVELDRTLSWSRSSLKQQINHYIQCNRSGRYLLSCQEPVPLGLWPIVLSKAIKQGRFNDKGANVVFHFILGPILQKGTDCSHSTAITTRSNNQKRKRSRNKFKSLPNNNDQSKRTKQN